MLLMVRNRGYAITRAAKARTMSVTFIPYIICNQIWSNTGSTAVIRCKFSYVKVQRRWRSPFNLLHRDKDNATSCNVHYYLFQIY